MDEISLVIPVKNEEAGMQALIDSIARQTRLPEEVIFVDGGSSDGTKDIIRSNMERLPYIRLVETEKSYPGEGRNIGLEKSKNDLVAFTDGGIILDRAWLEELFSAMKKEIGAEAIYGAYEPVADSPIKQASLLAYIPPKAKKNGARFRTDFIASSLFEKGLVRRLGGFPPFRAAEDKIFMEKVKESKAAVAYAPRAMVYWQVPGSVAAIFRRASEFSTHDIAAGRFRDWHFSVLRSYAVIFLFAAAGFIFSPLFFIGIFFVFAARIAFMFYRKAEPAGKAKYLFNPKLAVLVPVVLLTVDLGMFAGTLAYLFLNLRGKKI